MYCIDIKIQAMLDYVYITINNVFPSALLCVLNLVILYSVSPGFTAFFFGGGADGHGQDS